MAAESHRRLGLTSARLLLNSLGCRECRPAYRELLQEFLRGLDLDDDTRRRAEINPMRVLDDKRPEVQAQLADAPLLADHLCEACKEFHDEVRGRLDRPRRDLGGQPAPGPRAGLLRAARRSSSSTTSSARSRPSAAADATTAAGDDRRPGPRRHGVRPRASTAPCSRSRPRASPSATGAGVTSTSSRSGGGTKPPVTLARATCVAPASQRHRLRRAGTQGRDEGGGPIRARPTPSCSATATSRTAPRS